MNRNKRYYIELDIEELTILQSTHLINMLNKVRDNEGIHKSALLMMDKQLYHNLQGLRWLEKHGWISIRRKRIKRGRPRDMIYLAEKSRERLEYLNELYSLIKLSLAFGG